MNLWIFYPVLGSLLVVIIFLLRHLNYERKEREYLIKQHQQLAITVRYNHLQAEMEGKVNIFNPRSWDEATSTVDNVEGEVY